LCYPLFFYWIKKMNVTRTPPKHITCPIAFVNASTLGANTVLAAPGAGACIRVLSMALVSTGANAVKFQSASTDISATWPLAANGGLVLPYNEHGWFQTAANEALNVNLGTATATGVHIQYIIVGAP